MSAETTRQRGFFGRKRDEIDHSPSELDLRLRAAEGRAEAAEARVGDLQQELMFYGDAIRGLKSELESVTERVVPRVAPQVVELEARNAETAALRSVVDNLRAEVQTERDQLFAWRREVDAALTSVQDEILRTRAAIDETPERIRVALTPAADAMASVSARMAALAGTSLPPQALSEGAHPVWGDESGDAGRPYEGELESDSGYNADQTQNGQDGYAYGTEGGETGEAYSEQPGRAETAADSLRSLTWE